MTDIGLTMKATLPPQALDLPSTSLPIAIHRDLDSIEKHWRAFEATAIGSPYHRFDYLAAWHKNIAAGEGIEPLIITLRDGDGALTALLPLCQRRAGPLRVVSFMGAKHCNFNTGLWRAGMAHPNGQRILAALKAACPQIDLLMLRNVTLEWQGLANPLAVLGGVPSPSSGYKTALTGDFESWSKEQISSSTRGKMRRKEKHMAEHGPVDHFIARTPAEVERILVAFFHQKEERARLVGVPNAYATPQDQAFVRDCALTGLVEGHPALEMSALTVGDEIVATYGAAYNDDRWCALFNSMTMSEIARQSPGENLTNRMVKSCFERGFSTFDLGIGEAGYKDTFCPDVEDVRDMLIGMSALGHLAAHGAEMATRLKESLKQNPTAVRAVKQWRKFRSPGSVSN